MPDSNPNLTLAVVQTLNKITSQSELPGPPVLKFDGTAASYPKFMANFHDRVGSKQLADSFKLWQLVMCTTGEAQQYVALKVQVMDIAKH